MHTLNRFDDPLDKKISIDWTTAKKNPYSKFISPKEKLEMVIMAAYEDSKLTKSEFINAVESIIA